MSPFLKSLRTTENMGTVWKRSLPFRGAIPGHVRCLVPWQQYKWIGRAWKQLGPTHVGCYSLTYGRKTNSLAFSSAHEMSSNALRRFSDLSVMASMSRDSACVGGRLNAHQ